MIPFTSYRREVMQSMQDEALAAWKSRVPGKVGVSCLVMMPSLRVVTPNVPGPQYDLSIVIRCLHDPRVNNTGLSAEDVAMLNLRWLDGQILGGQTQLHGDDRSQALKPNYSYKGLLVYDSVLVGPMPQDISGRTFDPTITGSTQITISCADGAAAIYYTTDGSCPMPPANQGEATTVQVYSGPFDLPVSGLTVSAIAWDPGKLPSNVVRAEVDF